MIVHFSIITGGGMWIYRKFCHYRTEVSYLRVTTVEVENTKEANTSEVVQIEQPEVQGFYTLMTSLALLSTILAYFYLCDRYI